MQVTSTQQNSKTKRHDSVELSRYLNNSKGFTLVELLISIAIIGILAAVGIPQYTQYKVRAYDAHSKQALKDMHLLCNAYWLDTDTLQGCDLPKIKEATYGFNQNTDVLATLPPSPLDNFCASAKHNSSPNTYSIDSAAMISDNGDCGSGKDDAIARRRGYANAKEEKIAADLCPENYVHMNEKYLLHLGGLEELCGRNCTGYNEDAFKDPGCTNTKEGRRCTRNGDIDTEGGLCISYGHELRPSGCSVCGKTSQPTFRVQRPTNRNYGPELFALQNGFNQCEGSITRFNRYNPLKTGRINAVCATLANFVNQGPTIPITPPSITQEELEQIKSNIRLGLQQIPGRYMGGLAPAVQKEIRNEYAASLTRGTVNAKLERAMKPKLEQIVNIISDNEFDCEAAGSANAYRTGNCPYKRD